MLDLCYEEDAGAEVDFNVVMTGRGRRSSRCRAPPRARRSRRAELDAMLDLAAAGIAELTEIQHQALAG